MLIQPDFVLALAGGNALGAYQGGAICAMLEAGWRPSAVAGVSIGSVNAALLVAPRCGDPATALRMFWRAVAQEIFATSTKQRELSAAISALLFGRPTLALGFVAPFPAALLQRGSLLDAAPLRKTLLELIDFDALVPGGKRYILGATALSPDAVVWFDTARQAISVDHVLASCAMPLLFPSVFLGDREYVDGGMGANLPVEPLAADKTLPRDCIALDLFPPDQPIKDTLLGAAERLQNLNFHLQSRRCIDAASRGPDGLRVIHIALTGPEQAVKTLDFSRESIERRWAAGEADMRLAMSRLERSEVIAV